MKTKDRVLETALRLFNDNGLSKVTLRTIANEMGISQGNLCYHFKKREEIIKALYFNLVADIDEKMEEIKTNDPFKALFEISELIMRRFYAYRFLMLDFVQVMREHKNIKSHYKALSLRREQEFLGLIQLLVKENYLQAERFKNQYLHVYRRWEILGNFWLASAYTKEKTISESILTEYFEITYQSIYPYLTKKGIQAYQSIIK